MANLIDITDARYGRLIALTEASQVGKHRYWNCRCDCGKEKVIPMRNLRSGKTQSCGCLGREKLLGARFKDLTNQVFGRLTVMEQDGDKRFNGSVVWKCICECGKPAIVPSRDLLTGNTRSCGCLLDDHTKSLENENREQRSVDGAFVPLLRQKVQHNSTTGVKGVSIRPVKNKKDKYIASITIKGERHYLGMRNNLEDAIALRKSAEDKYFKPLLEKYQALKTCASPDCKKKFVPIKHNQEYCEPKCRFRHYKQLLRKSRVDLGLCPQCGGEWVKPKVKRNIKSSHCLNCQMYYKNRAETKKAPTD